MDITSQQLLQGSAGGAKKTYAEEVFSTYVYRGTGSAKTITNGVDLAGGGGMVWIKERTGTQDNILVDSVRGPTKRLVSNGTGGQSDDNNVVSAFTSSGFSVGTSAKTNDSGEDFTSWTFLKEKGFFDIVTYTGTGSNQSIAHNLGCIPGCIIVKNLATGYNWKVYHRGTDLTDPANYSLGLDQDITRGSSTTTWNDTLPTATHFTVGTGGDVNTNGSNFIAYLFAGGASDEPGSARSVNFDGTDDTLTLSSNPTPSYDDFHMTGDFTIESWIYPTDWSNSYSGLWGLGQYNDPGGIFFGVVGSTGKLDMQKANNTGGGYTTPFSVIPPPSEQWTHVALVRSGTTITVYYNGLTQGSWTDSTDWGTSTNKCFNVGSVRNGSGDNVDFFKGKISNMRVVKGTAVYTSSFRPPTQGLTDITNTKLLCCNKNTVTGSTVTPETITAVSAPSSSTLTPFDDPKGFKFGEEGDQNLIKCGQYIGSGNTPQDIYLGFEPQFVLIKGCDRTCNWVIFDNMRGTATWAWNTGLGRYLKPNANSAETASTSGVLIRFNPDGIGIPKSVTGEVNESNEKYIYIAVRRPDPLVGKAVEAATNVFQMSAPSSGAAAGYPEFEAGFAVDMSMYRKPAEVQAMFPSTRLNTYLEGKTTDTTVWGGWSAGVGYDYQTGYGGDGQYTPAGTYQAWMWKRHAGFDVVSYVGNGTSGKVIPHNLSKVPEMMWFKNLVNTDNWAVYHKGFNGGVNPEQYNLELNTTDTPEDNTTRWNDTAPTATQVTVGNAGLVNDNQSTYVAMLFASVEGISKVGYYAGSDSEQTITTGFSPRYLIVRNITIAEDWGVWDTLRGWTAGNDKYLKLNTTAAQTTYDFGAGPTSTGFTFNGNNTAMNNAGQNFIYYAHA